MTEPTPDPAALQPGGPGKSHHSSKWLFGPSEEHADALLRLATTTFGELSPAAARAALRRAHLEGAVAFADLAAGARLLAEQARVLEVAAGSAARTAGMDTRALAARTGLRPRTVQERYREHRVSVEEPGADPLALLVRDARGRPRPVALELDLSSGRFGFGHPQESFPDGEAGGRVVRWAVPLLTGPGAHTLLQALQPLALRILVGAESVDGQRVLDTDARAAIAEIARACAHAERVYPVLRQSSADAHYADQDPADVAAALGLPQGAGPVQVAAAADLATENALRLLVVLDGAEEYLRTAVTPAEEVVNVDEEAVRCRGCEGRIEPPEGAFAPCPNCGEDDPAPALRTNLIDTAQ